MTYKPSSQAGLASLRAGAGLVRVAPCARCENPGAVAVPDLAAWLCLPCADAWATEPLPTFAEFLGGAE
jgi:hypothetical protein